MVAKEAAGGERIGTARWTSLTHLKRRIREGKRAQQSAWRNQKAREKEEQRRGFYFSSLKMQMDPVLGKTRKFSASRLYQLKVGHGAIGTFLHRIGATETAECWWCGDAEQSVYTFVYKVPEMMRRTPDTKEEPR